MPPFLYAFVNIDQILAGLSDINKIRTNSTTQYLRRCDYVFLIAPIARVQTDDNVHKRLVNLSRTLGPRKALLCTKIDVGQIHAKMQCKLTNQEMPLGSRANQQAPTPEASERHSKLSRAYALAGTEKTRLTKALKDLRGKTKKDTQKHINKLG